MFEYVRRNNKLFQILLFLLIFPSFVLFGIQGYSRMRGAGAVAAKVGSVSITNEQLEQAQREVVARAQQQGATDLSQLDTPAARLRTLQQMVDQSLLQQAVRQQRLQATDDQVQRAILQIPQVAALHRPDGRFDVDAYRRLLQAQGLTPQQFEAEVRAQLLSTQVLGGVASNLIESRAAAARLASWEHQSRSVQLAWLPASSFSAQAQPDAAQLQSYYQAHQAAFQVPDQAEVEYLVLTPDAMRRMAGPGAQAAQGMGAVADRFSNMVYEDSRSFAKTAAAFGLSVQKASGVTATPRPGAGALANPALLQALFGANSLRDRRNVAAVEIAPQTWASARIVGLQPAHVLGFDQVRDTIAAALTRQRADQLAASAGAAELAKLRAGQLQPAWGKAQTLSQSKPDAKLPNALLQAAFGLDASKLPAYGGVAVPGQGYALIRLNQVDAGQVPAPELALQQQLLARALAAAGADAALQDWKQRIGVDIRYKPEAAR